jgi:hypothetical protein
MLKFIQANANSTPSPFQQEGIAVEKNNGWSLLE